MKQLAVALLLTFLGGCASVVNIPDPEPPVLVRNTNTEFHTIRGPATGKLVAAVYGFKDLTGQRKPSDKMANISTAVTQGSEVWLRQSVGDERQLKPMLFAGVIIEGGIIGYDSNVLTGGAGVRYLGIGPSTQYRQDIVTVTMRMTSTQTGEVLLSTSVTKTIISSGTNMTVFKFFDMGTSSFEAEAGNTINEPVNYAVRVAIEQAVVELIKAGEKRKLWKFKE